ncbi:hypothetical protein V5O48_016843 [Marasmius crinis-equi]|uniref:MULE transposase domain-containing protein n=1 Tax=Marasmius crinis-equi TaxID=585013 RepID=A0ABR3EQT2_9AGAR
MAVQEHNWRLLRSRRYSSLATNKPGLEDNYRWLLHGGDTQSLYRQYNRICGVRTSEVAHLNIHQWLDLHSLQYNKTLASIIAHYSARTSKDDHFEAIVVTPEMRESTWKYAHNSQLILDGTFGVCNRKLLLFIAMGVDEEKKGVPLAFMFFSVPSQNQFTKASLGTCSAQPFDIRVAITDTDLKECGALLNVFLDVWLLICKFHLRQSWQNQQNKALKGNTPIHSLLKWRIQLLEGQLVATTTIVEAQSLIVSERSSVGDMKVDNPANGTVYDAAMTHLRSYLLGF